MTFDHRSPLVSIVMPVRNAASTLPETLDSIRNQTLTRWELVAVDDHSTDDSREILTAASGSDDRIRLIDAPSRGIVSALNAGIESAEATLIARMDADDLMRPERLARQTAWMSSNDCCDIAGSRVRIFPESEMSDGTREYVRWLNNCVAARDIIAQRFVESPLAHPSVIFRSSSIRALGAYRDGSFPEDYELWLRAIDAGVRIGKMEDVLLDWRDSEHRASRTDPRYARERFDELRARWLARVPQLQSGRPLCIWGAGRRTRKRVRHLLERGLTPLVWVDIDPRKIGREIDGAPIVSPEWLARSDRPFVLAYVANHGARELIAARLGEYGYVIGDDWLPVG